MFSMMLSMMSPNVPPMASTNDPAKSPGWFRAWVRVRPLALTCAWLLACSGCTWVHMAPGASAVKIVEAEPANCLKVGHIDVSVRDSIAFYDRNRLRVREELETLARNEAPGLGADTLQPAEPPIDGHQRFIAWRCAR